MSPPERWDALAGGLLLTAGVFAVVTATEIPDRDLGGIAMGLIPLVLCLLGWRFAVWRRDH